MPANNTIVRPAARAGNNWIADVDHDQVCQVLLRSEGWRKRERLNGWQPIMKGTFRVDGELAHWETVAGFATVRLDEVAGVFTVR